jgi:hypothetical protein
VNGVCARGRVINLGRGIRRSAFDSTTGDFEDEISYSNHAGLVFHSYRKQRKRARKKPASGVRLEAQSCSRDRRNSAQRTATPRGVVRTGRFAFFGVPGQYAALWSLAVEEHFYLVWPCIIRKLTRRAALWCAAGIIVACPALRACAYLLGYHFSAGYTWLVADGLALGSLFALLAREWSDSARGPDGLSLRAQPLR